MTCLDEIDDDAVERRPAFDGRPAPLVGLDPSLVEAVEHPDPRQGIPRALGAEDLLPTLSGHSFDTNRVTDCLGEGPGVARSFRITGHRGKRETRLPRPVEAAAEAAGAAMVVRGRLRVSVDPWFARMVLAPELQRFLTRYPLLSVDVMTSNYREEMMTGVDVAVRFGPPDASSLITRKLLETPVLTVAAPAYLNRYGEPQSPHDLVHHEALLFRDPQTGLPFPWEFRRGGTVIEIKVPSRLVLDDPSVAVSACLTGQGIFQSLAIGLAPFLSRGELVQVLPGWSEELYPLYAFHPSRHLPPAKVRAFLDFIHEIAKEDPPSLNN